MELLKGKRLQQQIGSQYDLMNGVNAEQDDTNVTDHIAPLCTDN